MDHATCQIPAKRLRITWKWLNNSDNSTADMWLLTIFTEKTHPDAQEYVYSIGAGHITDGGVGVLILDGGHLTGKGIWADRGGGGASSFCQCGVEQVLPGKSLACYISLVWWMEKQPRSYFFSIKAFDSLSESHWSYWCDPGMDRWGWHVSQRFRLDALVQHHH